MLFIICIFDNIKSYIMAIPNKQVGWSTEAKLLHHIIRQLDRLTKLMSPKDPTTTTTTSP